MLPLGVGRLPSRAPRNNPIDLLLCSWVDVTLPLYCARAVGTSAQCHYERYPPHQLITSTRAAVNVSLYRALRLLHHISKVGLQSCAAGRQARVPLPPVSSRSRCLNPPQSRLLLYITEITLAWSMAFWMLAEQGGGIRRRS